jgi:hypothetical protein
LADHIWSKDKMKKAACETLAKALVPLLPSFEYEKQANAICRVPVGNVFVGMIFDSSGFSAEVFYPVVFAQPLYVPSEHYTLSFGKRLLGNWEYQRGQEVLLAGRLVASMEREGAFNLLEDLSSPDKMAVNLPKYHSRADDPYLQQAIAYSFAISRQFEEALRSFDRCVSTLQEMQRTQPEILWPGVLLDEVARLRTLVESYPEAALKQLDEWTEYTRSHLNLPA